MALRPSRRNAPFSAFSSNFTSFSIPRPGCTRAAGAHAHIFLSSPSRPGIWRSALLMSSTTRARDASGGLIWERRSATSLCTVDLLIPNFRAALPHCRIVVYDVISDRNRPFLDIFLHGSSPENVFYILLHLFRFMQIPFPKQKHCRLVVLRTAVFPQVVSLHASFPLCLLLIGLDKQSRNFHRMLVFIQRYHNHISGINQFTRAA